MRAYGPLFRHLYGGLDEATVLDTWTVEKFERHRHFADRWLKGGTRGQ